MKEQRVLRELFLAGADCGIAGPRFEYEPINYLEANATKMVWVYHQVTEQAAEEQVLRAEKAFEGWMNLGADISALRHYYTHILTGEYKDKRYMLASALLDSLAL